MNNQFTVFFVGWLATTCWMFYDFTRDESPAIFRERKEVLLLGLLFLALLWPILVPVEIIERVTGKDIL